MAYRVRVLILRREDTMVLSRLSVRMILNRVNTMGRNVHCISVYVKSIAPRAKEQG